MSMSNFLLHRLWPVLLVRAALVLLLGQVGFACAWGNVGHIAIGAMADQLIAGTAADRAVHRLLRPGETLASVSVWADCAKGYCGPLTPEMDAFVAEHVHHAEYHYSDIPFQRGVYQAGSVGTSDHDVVQTLTRCIAVLQGPGEPAANGVDSGLSQRQALLLLVHLLGDLHQPLHVAPAYLAATVDGAGFHFVAPQRDAEIDNVHVFDTKGGNYLQLGARNFHSYWDSEVVHAVSRQYGWAASSSKKALPAGTRSSTAEGLALARSLLGEPRQDQTWQDLQAGKPQRASLRKLPARWASETARQAGQIHQGLSLLDRREVQESDGQRHFIWRMSAPAGYAEQSARIAQRQLALAGQRLAELLIRIYAADSRRGMSKK